MCLHLRLTAQLLFDLTYNHRDKPNRVIAVGFRSLLALLLFTCGVGTPASGNDVPKPRSSEYERIEIGDYVSYKRKASFPVALKLALMKWPDRRSSLASPDGVLLRWEKLSSLKEIEVCLVRVLAAAESIEEAKLILVTNGLSAPIDAAFPPKYADAAISGSCLLKSQHCGRAVSKLWFPVLPVYGFSYEMAFRAGRVFDVKISALVL